MTFPLLGADGKFRQFLTRIAPVLGQDNEIVRWVGTNTEFESEISAKEALAVSEAKFRVLTDALPQMVWSTRPDGFHYYYNARWYEFTGMMPGTTHGDGWVDMFHADDRQAAVAKWQHCIATGDDCEIEYRVRHHSGEYRWTLGRALPVRDEYGQILRWIGTCTDIHESKLITERDLLQAAEDRRILKEDLRDALAKDQMWLAYQPVVDSKTNVVSGFEALLRWNHPERGPISPSLFIPIAEEASLIGALGEWALHTACDEAARWPGKLKVAVNVSPCQFATGVLPKIVESALSRSGLAPSRLELEITEGVFLQESADTDSIFAALKKMGVRLALDDFGTGYSSLGYLKTAPFDRIKIDQSFVKGATEPGSRNGAIIAAIVALADALGMETTAEGIETLDQLALIRSLCVSHVQGFVYSQPVGNVTLLERCAEGAWTIEPTGRAVQRGERFSMYRKIAAIHDNHRYDVVLRNLSATGALIEGIYHVPLGTKFVMDFGDGQLAVSTVVRTMEHQQGVIFDERLVSDGNGGLCTNRRVSPYMMAAAGLPAASLPSAQHAASDSDNRSASLPAFSTTSARKAS